MRTYLEGRVRNTKLPLSQGLLPLLEAVVNSIHAIEDLQDFNDKGKIIITLRREPHQTEFQRLRSVGRSPIPKIMDFTIQDNGCGFDKVNFEAFATLDTPHKAQKGCRGMGRLMWLKAFELVEIDSVFSEEGKWVRRNFEFSLPDGVTNERITTLDSNNAERKTIVRLKRFKSEYQAQAPKSTLSIAQGILNHCLWYYLREGQMPDIEIVDQNESYSLISLYEENIDRQAQRDEIEIRGYKFELLHIKFRSEMKENATASYCANNRLVEVKKLCNDCRIFSHRLSDREGEYSYQCYITSPVLDKCVVSDRSEFDFDLDSELYGGNGITKEIIDKAVIERIKAFLADDIETLKKATSERVTAFVEGKAPRYRGILDSSLLEELTPSSSDKEIELKLHEKLFELETAILKDGQDLLISPLDVDPREFREAVEDFMRKIDKVKSADLASYVFYRRQVLELLQKLIQSDNNDKYAKEEKIHNLIFPMRTTSDGVERLNENLWIIDERLTFHHFLASDMPICKLPITDAKDGERPDIVSMRLNRESELKDACLIDNPILVAENGGKSNMHVASLTIVEFKRPMRNDAQDPFEQVYSYCEKIRDKGMKTIDGRPIPNAKTLPCYAYIIADITENIEKQCKRQDLQKSYDGMSYFGYKSYLHLYIEVISYDKLLCAAMERNYAYFDKLGISSI